MKIYNLFRIFLRPGPRRTGAAFGAVICVRLTAVCVLAFAAAGTPNAWALDSHPVIVNPADGSGQASPSGGLLVWQDAGAGAEGYRVLLKENSVPGSEDLVVELGDSGARSHLLGDLNPNATYFVQVEAFGSGGTTLSAVVTFGTAASSHPSAPPANGRLLHLDAGTGVFTDAVGGSPSGDGGAVAAWEDSGGRGNHVALAEGSAPVLMANSVNGLPSVTFSGTGRLQASDVATFKLGTGDFAWFHVNKNTKQPGAGPGNDYSGIFGNRNSSSPNGAFISNFQDSGVAMSKITDSASSASSLGYGPDDRRNLWTLLDASRRSGVHQAFQNGVQFLDDASAGSLNIAGDGPMNVGAVRTDLEGPVYVGEIAELIIYDRTLTDRELLDARLYLAGKYALGFESRLAAPSVSLNAPIQGANFLVGKEIELSATANDAGGGTVAQVEFFVNGLSLGIDSSGSGANSDTYEIAYTPTTTGTLDVCVVAADSDSPAPLKASDGARIQILDEMSDDGRPNLIFIMADDLGWSDTSTGRTNLNNPSSFFETPTMDTLAIAGMAFTNAYTNGPNCAPTRAALLTGQYAQRPTNNVYLVGSLNRGGDDTLLVGPDQGLPGGQAQIPGEAVTIAETLKTAGYATVHLGKYHVGSFPTSDNDPYAQGFDFNYGGGSAGGPGSYHADLSGVFVGNIGTELDPYGAPYTQEYVDQKIKPWSDGTDTGDMNALVGTAKHVTDAMTDAAIDFMTANGARPFYMQFHHYAVHTPIGNSQARSDLLAKYQAKPDVDDDGDGAEVDSYAALIEGMDQSVARLKNYLQTTEDPRNPGKTLSQNTLLIFFSDNGGREKQAYNGPLKGQKGELDEGGIRVPMIAWSENLGLVKSGAVNHTPVAGIDFYQTFAELAGASTSSLTLDGESLTSILKDETTPLGRDALYWHLPGYLVDSRNLRPRSMIRSGDWKLMYNYEDLSFELYYLANDIGESIDIAEANPETVYNLGMKLMRWLEEMDSPLAVLRSGKPAVNRTVDGFTYANGVITEHSNESITVNPGEEVPFLLPRLVTEPPLQNAGVTFGNLYLRR